MWTSCWTYHERDNELWNIIRALFTMKESLNISRTNMRRYCRRMHLDTRKSPLHLSAAPLPKTAKWCMTGGTLRRCGWRRSGLLALLTATILTILCDVSELQCKVSQKIQGSDPEDEGDDGVPLQGTPWQRLARASGPGSRLSSPLTEFYWKSWFLICISAIFLLLQ